MISKHTGIQRWLGILCAVRPTESEKKIRQPGCYSVADHWPVVHEEARTESFALDLQAAKSVCFMRKPCSQNAPPRYLDLLLTRRFWMLAHEW